MELRFNFIDLFHANRLALSLRRILLQFLGLVVGYAGYYFLTLISLLLAGLSWNQIWSQFGIFPCLFAAQAATASFLSKVVFGLGCVYFIFVTMMANTAVSRSAFMKMKGNNFYTLREALGFALRKSGSMILTPVGIGVLIFATLSVVWLIGLLGRIPLAGELGIALFASVWIITAGFIIFLFVVAGTATIFTPAILATTDEDTFEAIFQSFSTTWTQPWRMLAYVAIVLTLSASGFVMLAVFVKRAFLFMNALMAASMGDKYLGLVSQAQHLLQKWTAAIHDTVYGLFGALAPYVFFTHDFPAQELPPVVQGSAYLMTVNFLLAGALVFSYFLTTFNVGNTICFLVVRKKKDGENLLTRHEDDLDKTKEPPQARAEGGFKTEHRKQEALN